MWLWKRPPSTLCWSDSSTAWEKHWISSTIARNRTGGHSDQHFITVPQSLCHQDQLTVLHAPEVPDVALGCILHWFPSTISKLWTLTPVVPSIPAVSPHSFHSPFISPGLYTPPLPCHVHITQRTCRYKGYNFTFLYIYIYIIHNFFLLF